MADLNDFYPSSGVAPDKQVGGRPVAASGGSAPASIAAAPAFWTLAFVGVALLLLHAE